MRPRPARTALEDEGRECLDQVGARADHAQRILGRRDATRADENLVVVKMTCHQGDDLQRTGQQGSARDAALTQVVVDRRVRGDDPGQAQLFGQLNDGDDVLVGQVGSDLDEQRHDAVGAPASQPRRAACKIGRRWSTD